MVKRAAGVVLMMIGCRAYGQPFTGLSIHPGNGVVTNVAPVRGPVNVTVNPGASGGGIVALDPASDYYGRTTLGCGTLVVSTFADGGVASAVGASPAEPENLVIGSGTLRYIGPNATAKRGFTVTGASAVFDTATDLTLGGQVHVENGCFFKTGPGTLFLAGPGTNYIPAASSAVRQDNIVNIKANGDAPTDGLASISVLEGTLAWGVPGQTVIVNGTDTHVGGYTSNAAGGEKPGFIDIYGGDTFFNCWLAIGRHNGNLTTAPVPLESRVRVFGGNVEITHLTMGRNKKTYNTYKLHARPTFEVHGGSVLAVSTCRIGDDQGGDSVVRVLGGTFTSNPACRFGAMGGRSTNLLEIANGGRFTAWEMNLANVGDDTDTTVDVHDGGILNPYRILASTGTTRIRFDGGIFRPRFSNARSAVEQSVDAVFLSTNGVAVEITAANSVLEVNAPILTAPDLNGAPDGGITLSGNANGRLDLGGANTYTGPTTVSNGILILRGSLPTTAALTLLPGSGLGITNAMKTVMVDSLTLGAPDKPGTVDFHIGAAADSSAKLVVSGAVTLRAPTSFKLYLLTPGTLDAAADNGTFTFLQLPSVHAASIDPVRFVVANPAVGKTYVIRTEISGADTLYRVTIAGDALAGDAWMNAAGGDWHTSDNWSGGVPPNAPFAAAAFTTEAQPGGATVSLDAPVTVGAISFASTEPYTLSGGTLTLDGGAAGATLASDLGNHTVAVALVSAGPLTVNPAASGAGTVRLTGANSITGPLITGSGTVAFEGADALGGLANPTLGPGTFLYAGTPTTLSGLTLAPGANRAAIFKNEGDLALSAPLTALNGAFIKSGAGTLTLDGPGTFAFGSYHNGMAHDFEGFPANGDSPTRCFTAFTVSQGKIVWGEPGQVVTIGNNVWIGTRNANGPGEAVTGEVEINGGTTTINGSIFIGVANGDPISAPVPLHPRLTINGGDTTVSGSLNMGWDNRTTTATYYGTQQAHNAQPELVVNGGVLRIHGEFYPSYHGGVSPTNRVTINGGELHARRAYFGHDRFGEGPAAATIFEINGGLVSLTEDFRMARYVADSFFRFNGGILRAWDIQKADGAGDSQIWFNGGVFQPIWGGQDSVYRTFDRHTNVWVGAGGFIIDTSYWPAPDDAHPAYDINQNISHDPALGDTPDGGIIKRGVSGIVIIRSGQRYSFTGPIMVEEGVLGIEASALWENTLIMHDGTTLRFSNKDLPQVVDSFYAETGTITIDLSFDASTAQSQPLVVSNTLSLAADVIVVGHANGLYVPTLPSGQTTTVLVCNASQTLDAGLFRASPLFPNRLADFNNITLDGGPYAGWQAIVMSVADAPEHVWNATASGGAWDTAGNWLVNAVPPAVPGASVRFPPAAGAAVPVTPADGTLFGRLTLESGPGQGYALSGGTLVPAGPGNDQPTVMTLSGTHTIASPLSVAEQGLWLDTRISATLAVNGPLSGPGRLYANATPSGGGLTVLSGTSTHTGGTEVRSGTLRVENLAALGSPARAANNLLVGPGTFHYTGPSTFTDLGIRFASGAAGRPAIIRVDNDLTLAGPASQANGIFAKFGPGTLRLAYPGTNQFSTSGAGDSNSTTPWPANGDAPAADAGGSGRSFIAEGRFVVGAPGQLFRFNNELDIGCQPRGLGDENTYAVTMDVIGGTIDLSGQYFGIGVNFKRENGVSTYPTVNMYDGTMTIRNLTMAYDTIWKNHSTKATLNIYGGTFNVLEQFRLGHHKGNTSNPPHATVNVYNGAVNHTHASQGTTFGWMNSGDPKPACTGTLNLFGGEFNELWIMKMANHDAISYLNLHGGVLRAENITHVPGSVGQSHVFFNGGVYMPLGTNTAQRTLQGLTSATVSTNGAVIDTSLAAATITFAQPLLHDPALEDTPDGGLIKTGAVDLVLAAASTFTGPAVVQSGTLRATVDGAVPCALHVDADAVFDAAGITHSIARVTGAGLCANGTVRVTERVTPEKVLTFENLTLASGVTHHFGTNVVIAVSGHLSAEGGGFIDFGRTPEAPLTIPHSAVVMTYGTSDAVFSGWRARGTGQPDGKVALRLVRDESGPVKVVRAELIHSGTLMIVQ